jgi:AmmeMemoRadiSam system protein B/AmmeMemoRadiSam system protein A
MRDDDCSGRVIVVIGDSHTGHGSAEIAVWAAGEFATPLGALPVDQPLAEAVENSDERIEFDRKAFGAEHPVENQLPFIQTFCPGARIVPVVIRQASLENAEMLAAALVSALEGESALIVASTDLSHYHSYDEARRMDEIALQSIVSLDPKAVADSSRRCEEAGLGGGDPLTMCSQGAVMTTLFAAQRMGANRATVLAYANSGDVPLGAREQVVGYGAVALWQDANAVDGPGSFEQSPLPVPLDEPLTIGPDAQAQLLNLARNSAARFIETESFPAFHTSDLALLQPLGAYVTFELGDALRGCLGRLESDLPLYLNVQYAAAAAALGDTRFPAVTAEELDSLSIEVTVVHPMHQVESTEDIQIGRDGILMRVGEQDRALFLPQVPVEQGWDLDETLVQLCLKAGLPEDAWQRPDVRFSVFPGQWFGEDE